MKFSYNSFSLLAVELIIEMRLHSIYHRPCWSKHSNSLTNKTPKQRRPTRALHLIRSDPIYVLWSTDQHRMRFAMCHFLLSFLLPTACRHNETWCAGWAKNLRAAAVAGWRIDETVRILSKYLTVKLCPLAGGGFFMPTNTWKVVETCHQCVLLLDALFMEL